MTEREQLAGVEAQRQGGEQLEQQAGGAGPARTPGVAAADPRTFPRERFEADAARAAVQRLERERIDAHLDGAAMIAPLLVLIAHGLDLAVTLHLLTLVGGWGETNPIARAAHDVAGAGGLVGMKLTGALVMLRLLRPDVPRAGLRLAVAAGSGFVLTGLGLLTWSVVR